MAALVMVLTRIAMATITTMTPVRIHDHGHGHGTAASGLVIAIHIDAVYLSSPLTDRLVDRYGRTEIDGAEPGTVVHVIATDPAAPLDLPAWCHMTGHHYLGLVRDAAGASVYALRITAGARPTRAGAPWHAGGPEG